MQLRTHHWLFAFAIALTIHACLFLTIKLPQQGAEDLGVGGIYASIVQIKQINQGETTLPKAEPPPPEIKQKKVEPPPKPIVKKKPKPKPKPKKQQIAVKEEIQKPKPKEVIKETVPEEVMVSKPSVAPLNNTSNQQTAKLDEREVGTKAPSGVDKTTSTGGASVKAKSDYKALLRNLLEKKKRYPKNAQKRRQEGVVKLWFKIDKSGKLLAHKIVASSGHKLLDREVEKLIKRAAPLPAFPSDLKQSAIEFTVPIGFEMIN
ncbi:MAG: energy transducer TonB [Pseudomonadota bacterium]